jgi:hypothetical protein
MIGILQLLVIICISVLFTIFIGNKLRFGPKLSILIFIIHTLYCIVYWHIYTQIGWSDAVWYFDLSHVENFNWMPGNYFVISLAKVFTNDLVGLNMFGGFMIFNLFGVFGIQLLLRILLDIWPKYNNKISFVPYLIILLPGQSFWSSAIGKDGISYFAVTLLLYGLHKNKYLYLLPSIFLMFMIRPHIALVMMLSLFVVFIISKLEENSSKYLLLIFSALSVTFGMIFALDFLRIDSFTINNIIEFINDRKHLDMGGGSSYSVENKIFIQRFFDFMFSPLSFSIKDLPVLIFTLENLFILIFLIRYVLIKFHVLIKNIRTPIISYSIVYSSVLIVIMSLTTSNTGIALRQKYMILPFLFILGAMAARKSYLKLGNSKNLVSK